MPHSSRSLTEVLENPGLIALIRPPHPAPALLVFLVQAAILCIRTCTRVRLASKWKPFVTTGVLEATTREARWLDLWWLCFGGWI